MAWLTVIGPAVEQVDYRLQESAGCGLAHGHEPGGPAVEPAVGDGQEHAQVDYRMEETNRLTWFGGGLADVGITAGTALQGEVDKARARALMDGVHPGSGEQLVKPKRAAHPASKIVAAPLLDALDKTAADRGVPLAELGRTTWAAARLARMARMVERDGEAHRIPVRDAERLAAEITAPIRLEDLYEPAVLQVARAHRTETVRIGDRGFDLTIDIPKSPSVVWALADTGVAGQLQEAFRAAVLETLADVEAWCSYGMRGEHGGGKTARRIDTSGLLGWVMWHDVARPVHGQTPDPHLHAHAVIAHMVRGTDGKWSTPGNGGREFHRHVEAAGALAQARFRAKTTALGYRWERRDSSRVWELAGVPEQARELFSKRAAQTNALLTRLGIDPATATTAQTKYASGKCREGKDTAPPLQAPGSAPESTRPGPAEEPGRGPAQGPLQEPGVAPSQASPPDTRSDAALHVAWRAQASAAHLDPDAIVAAARGDGPDHGPGAGPGGPTPGPDGPTLPPTPPPGPAPEPSPAPAPPTAPSSGPSGGLLGGPSAEEVAAAVFAPETGLTSHTKVVARPKLLAAVLDELPAGVVDVAAAEDLADAVVALPGGPVLPLLDAAGPAFQTHRERYTTRDIVEAEHLALAAAERGLGQGLAVVAGDTVAMAISAFEATRGFALSGEQRAVVERLTGAGHGVDAVIGVAGAGKTTLMAAARTAWNAAGYTVRGATTAAVAAQALATEAGIGSQTIASLLAGIDDRERPGLDGVDVLVLDEAAMVDDRDLARLLTAATQAGTKVVAIGDPLQLRAIGVGGAFRAIHDRVDGLVLTENRRQREDVERAALQTWRDGDRTGALRTWADAGRVHAGDGRDDTLAALLTNWATVRAGAPFADAHAELNELLVLAGTNADVDALNAGARAIRRAAGEITGDDRHYRLAGGGHIALAVGDHVRVRRNDYRTRRKHARPDDVDVLNGYRGIVVDFTGRDGRDPVIQWRRDTADGPVTDTAAFTALQVSRGEISHGTAMTVAAAQGQSGERALVYGMGLDPHALYPAMSRDKARVDLYLPRGLLETDADRIRHGTPAGPADDLTRAITAYAATLQGDRADKLITPQLDTTSTVPPPAAEPAAEPARVPRPAPADPAPAIGDKQLQGERAVEVAPWHQRPYGRRTDAELDELHASLTKDLALYRRTEQHLAAEMARAEHGEGPAAAALTVRRDALTRAAQAAGELRCLNDTIAGVRQRALDLHEQRRDAAAEAARNPLKLRLAGTSRAEVRARAADLTDQCNELQKQINAAYEREPALQRAAVAPYRPGAPQAPRLHTLAHPPYGGSWEHHGGVTAELADLADRWDTHHAAAIAADRTSAHSRAHSAACHEMYGTDLVGFMRPPASNAVDHTAARLAAVTAELDTRRQLPTRYARAEQQQRAAYRTRQAAEQRAARAARAAEEAQHVHRHDHGPHHGPSHGISR